MKPIAARLLLHVGVVVFVVAAALALYHHHVAAPARRIGVVDIGDVMRASEAAFSRALAAHPGADGDGASAVSQAFARRLSRALEELPQACGCLVVASTALVGRHVDTIDLTPLVVARMSQP